MKQKYIYLLFLWLFSLGLSAQISDKISITKEDFYFVKINGYDRIQSKIKDRTSGTGNPELPMYRVSYVLPLDARVTDVIFSNKVKQQHEQQLLIYPVQQPIPTGDSTVVEFTNPNPKIYRSSAVYPGKLYEIESDQLFMGYHVVTLRIFPFEYLPNTRKLNYFSQLEFTVHYSSGTKTDVIYSATQNLYRAEQCKDYVGSLVRNPEDVVRFGSNSLTIRDGKNIVSTNATSAKKLTKPQKTKSLSVLDEQAPDYIIITNNELKPVFQTLADWKTRKGVFAIIKTTEEIDAAFGGSDLQEKIRNYLLDCHRLWGSGLFVLLGGGKDIVPTRMALGDDQKILYPADKYYSTLSTDVSFATDFFVFLGRLPVENASQANITIGKIIKYETANLSDLSYLKNNLYADAYMSYGSTPATLKTFCLSSIKNYVNQFVSGNVTNKYICDNADCNGSPSRYTATPSLCPAGDIEFNHYNFKTCLENGANLGVGKFHFIYHMDHSSSQGIGASSKDKGDGITKFEMGSLGNGDAYQVFMSSGCHPANFAQDCVGKNYLISPSGGVAFIGNTDVGWDTECDQLDGFLSSMYDYYHTSLFSIGKASQLASEYVTNGHPNWRLHLLGDPEMQLWTANPTDSILNILLDTTPLTLGSHTLNVTLSGLNPTKKSTICFWKGAEIYTTKYVTGSGTWAIPFIANTSGDILVTVTSHNYKPYKKTITVTESSNPNLSVSTVDFGDGLIPGVGIGNANGQNDAGETINLTLGVKNSGVNTATGVTATLSSSSPLIDIASNQGSFGDIAGGATVTSNQFSYVIRKGAPGKDVNKIARPECLANDPNPVTFTVTMKDATNAIWTHTYNIDVFKDSLIQRNKIIVSTSNGDLIPQSGETVSMDIALQNVGKATSRGLIATLTAVNVLGQPCATILSGPVVFPDISTLETKTANFSFIPKFSTPANQKFKLHVANAYGKSWDFLFDLSQKGPAITGADFTSSKSAITMTWNVPLDVNGIPVSIGGYNIYRCDVDASGNPTNNYVKLNNLPLQSAFYCDDKGLNTFTKYSYKITSMSTSGNDGIPANIIAWTSYPTKNLYPITMDPLVGSFHTPINIADINNDGKKEIFAGTGGGMLVCLNDYGNELFDIDNNLTTYSGFAQLGYELWAVPAIGDINKKGIPYVVEPTRNYKQDNAIFCYSAQDNNPYDKKPDLVWNKPTPQKQYLKGVVLSNIDNSIDGSLEVVTCSDERGVISVYNSDGTLRSDIACTNTYSAIAVADINGSGKKIIQASGQDINVWNNNGSYFGGGTTPSLYHLSLSGYRFVGSVIVCDIDNSNDGNKEILTFAINSNSPNDIKLFAIKSDGTPVSGFDGTQADLVYSNSNWYQDLSVGDLNNDGYLEVVTFATNGIKVWNHLGQISNINYPSSISSYPTASVPILADVDDDHTDVEILFGSANKIFAYKFNGSPVVGFPLQTKAGNLYSLAVSDVDNDDKNEVISTGESFVDMWQTNGIPSKIEWGTERHDQYNTGEYGRFCEPTIIATNTTWSSNQSPCGDVVVKSGTLTINNNSNLTMDSSSLIIVMSGASLIVDAGIIANANIKALAGSNVIVQNNGRIVLSSNGELNTEAGAIVDMPYGSVEK